MLSSSSRTSTESEGLAEIDRFCDAMIQIRKEVQEVVDGKQPKGDNIITHAPHTVEIMTRAEWTRPYTREQAAYPLPWLKDQKFWPSVGRIDDGEHASVSRPDLALLTSR